VLIVQGTPVNIIVGSQVWVEDPEIAWIDGEVTKINGTNATIITTDGKTVRFSPNHQTGLLKAVSLGLRTLDMILTMTRRN